MKIFKHLLILFIIISYLILFPQESYSKQKNNIRSEYLTNESKDNDLIKNHVYKYSKKYNLDPNLVLSIIKIESNFDKTSIKRSKNGIYYGLMQINFKLHRKKLIDNIKIKNIVDIESNIHAGCFILSQYLNKHKCIKKAISKYGGSKSYYKKVVSTKKKISFI